MTFFFVMMAEKMAYLCTNLKRNERNSHKEYLDW